MTYKDVLHLIEEGEGFEVEFKRKVSTPEKIAKTLSAMANTKGGYILFGVDDDGSIVGIESEKSEVELIEQAGSEYCIPAIHPIIDIVPFDGTDVVVAYVPESDDKPHLFNGSVNGDAQGGEDTRVYIRVNDKTVMASKEVVKILRSERPDAKPIKIEIGENEKRLFRYLEEHERITVAEFARLVNISERRASRILVLLVRAGVVRIHTMEKRDYYTLAHPLSA
ncbi:MAG: ATP-binding protein [Ignavibacteria bacterium]